MTQFFRSTSNWPKSPAELDSLVKKLQKLLEVSFAALWIPALGLKAAGPTELPDSGLAPLLPWLEERIRSIGSEKIEPGQVRQIQATGEGLPRAVPPFIALTLINGIGFGEPGVRSAEARREYGALVVGGDRPLPQKVEMLLVSVAQYLSDLAVIDQAKSAVFLRDQFLSIASHELKTPLTSIYGLLQLQERMARGQGVMLDPEKRKSFLRITVRQVERLNELIDGLLDVSRIQNGRFMVEPSDSDAALLLDEVVNSRLRVIGQESGVRIEVDSPPNLPVQVDPVRFEEVITNLGMNAIRFSPEGGVVWFHLTREGEDLLLRVRDQGPALPEQDRARIFQPFERAQRTSRLGGLGLGLYISRQIAQLHGGDVRLAESLPGRGNLFEARFPIRQVEQKQKSAG